MSSKQPRSILDEIGQTKPSASKQQEALIALMRTTDAVKYQLAKELDGYDVTPQQYNVLRILRGAGKDGLPTLAIADRMIERTPGITRLVDRLEGCGLAERSRCQNDRRRVFAIITDKGLELLETLDPVIDSADRTVMAGLPVENLEPLLTSLSMIRAGLGSQGA